MAVQQALQETELVADEAVRVVDDAVADLGASADQLIAILQQIQHTMGYLPKAALRRTAEVLDMPFMQVFQVATFYKAFSLEPRGRRVISVCTGTACHVRQSPLILEALERKLGVEVGQTTADGEFTLLKVGCLGACALGPVIDVNGEVFGQMTVAKAEKLPDKLLKEDHRGTQK